MTPWQGQNSLARHSQLGISIICKLLTHNSTTAHEGHWNYQVKSALTCIRTGFSRTLSAMCKTVCLGALARHKATRPALRPAPLLCPMPSAGAPSEYSTLRRDVDERGNVRVEVKGWQGKGLIVLQAIHLCTHHLTMSQIKDGPWAAKYLTL